MNPKSPWKLKVIKVAKSMGVKDAAKQFKVAKETLQGWIDESAKFCDDIIEEEFSSKEVIENDFVKEAVSKPKLQEIFVQMLFSQLNLPKKTDFKKEFL